MGHRISTKEAKKKDSKIMGVDFLGSRDYPVDHSIPKVLAEFCLRLCKHANFYDIKRHDDLN